MKKIKLDDPLAQEYLKEHRRLLNKIFNEPERSSPPQESAERKAPSDRGAVPIPAETRRPL